MGLKKSSDAYQRDAELKQPPTIPLGRGLCLMQVTTDHFSLADISNSYYARMSDSNSKFDVLLEARRQLEELMGETGEGEDALKNCQKMVTMNVMDKTPATILRCSIKSSCTSGEMYYGRSRAFASRIGILSGISVFLNSANACKAENLFFACRDDVAVSSGLFNFNLTGLENSVTGNVPFRLTRNITNALTPVLVLGCLASCMGCLLDAAVKDKESLEVHYYSFFNSTHYFCNNITFFLQSLLFLILLEYERSSVGSVVDIAAVKVMLRNLILIRFILMVFLNS